MASQTPRGAPGRPERVEVWVELSEPPLGSPSSSGNTAADRKARALRIAAQQERAVAALRVIGGVERGRLRVLRNAVAVELSRDRIDAARRIPGVQAVRIIRRIERDPREPRD